MNGLTLVPNKGYALDAANFSAPLPYPDYVSNVVFSQSTTNAANVLCAVSLIPGSVMPSNDIIIDLCVEEINLLIKTFSKSKLDLLYIAIDGVPSIGKMI